MNFISAKNNFYYCLILVFVFFLISLIPANAQTGSVGTVGLFQMQQIIGNVGIGSTAPGQALDVQGTARATAFNVNGYNGFLGSWTSNSANTVYQAATDLFVMCNGNSTGVNGTSLNTDGNNPPTTQRGFWQVSNAVDEAYSFVRKNDYWECVPTGGGGSVTYNAVFAIAIGS